MVEVPSKIEKICGVSAIVEILKEEGIEIVFGIPGSHTLALMDELDKNGIKIILTRHEEGAVFMADGYARVGRRVGVCSATAGPGATNLITGVANAYVDGVPILVITGHTPSSSMGRTAHQETSGIGRNPHQVEIFKNITKCSLLIPRASKIQQLLRHAFRIMLNGRFGPVNCSIPSDIFYDPVEFEKLPKENYRMIRSNNADKDLIKRAAKIILNSNRPVILAGQRCLFPDSTNEILKLAEEFSIPVVSPLNAKGVFPETHPLSLGCIDLLGQKSAERYLKSISDLVLAIGENFEEWTTLLWDPKLIEGKNLIQIDVDPLEIGKNYSVTVGIDGTIRTIVNELRQILKEMNYKSSVPLVDIEELKEREGYFYDEEVNSNEIPIKPQRAISDIRKALPENTIVFADAGHTVRWVGKYFKANRQSFFSANIFEPMGYGTAAAIGGKLAAPDKPVVSITGDGAFLMNGMEFSTACNYNIPVVWIIMNDGRLNMVSTVQSVLYKERYVGTTFKNPDYTLFAKAFGGVGFEVKNTDDIIPSIKNALDEKKPAIVDIHIDPEEIPPMKPRTLLISKAMRLPGPGKNPKAVEAFFKMIKEK